jgi:muramidase (phage lysozyme)
MNNRKAFLDMLAHSEIGPKLLRKSDNGYNVIVGGDLFKGYTDHPRRLIDLPKLKIKSTAAGRYQILERYFDAYKAQLKLPDFSPQAQDAIALQMIKECGALGCIDTGEFAVAVKRCKSRWASLPGAGYGQHENGLDVLRAVYLAAGGIDTMRGLA